MFEGTDSRNEKKIVMKILKPVKKRKIKREIRILQILRGGTNIIDISDVVRDPELKIPTLVLWHIIRSLILWKILILEVCFLN